MAKTEQDAGLGLKEFLGGGQAKDEAPKQEVDAKPVESKPAPVEVQKPVEAKAQAAKPSGLDKDAKGAEKVDAKAKPADAKPDGPNWDDDTNPWKTKATEFEKRYKDTHRWGNEVNQKYLETQRQQQELVRRLDVLNKKMDGTYDPQRDEPPPPDPEAIRTWGTIQGKAEASLAAMVEQHGEDEVMRALEKYAQIFRNDRGVQERILQSNHPVKGAMEAVRAYEFTRQYGSDPTAILTKFREEWEANELPKHEARIRAELSSKQPEPRGIGKVQGTSGALDQKVAKDNAGRPKSLAAVFGK